MDRIFSPETVRTILSGKGKARYDDNTRGGFEQTIDLNISSYKEFTIRILNSNDNGIGYIEYRFRDANGSWLRWNRINVDARI